MPEFAAPGRVNLIGDHTDYNGGFVLPFAVDLECVVDAQLRSDGVVRVSSEAFDAPVELPADGSVDPRDVNPRWGRIVAGVLCSLARRGRAPVGIDARVSSSVPVGGGLSSSAALEVALSVALCDAGGLRLSPIELAQSCQEAELLATSVPCGIMDQLASVCGRRGSALLIDCRSLTVEPVPISEQLTVLVVDSGVSRALDHTAYAERRAECEAIAAALGLASLRDATREQVEAEPRARHVVLENERVLAFADALRRGDIDALGPLLLDSHASLRDDFQVSTPELDVLVEKLVEAGALGARLTGAGFGGSVVALAATATARSIAASIDAPSHLCRPVDGAARRRAARSAV
jgi:galactokinase